MKLNLRRKSNSETSSILSSENQSEDNHPVRRREKKIRDDGFQKNYASPQKEFSKS